MRLATTACAPAAILMLAGHAASDITEAEWNGDTDFTYAVSYMPDLDQKRAGLACNGNMFCVPTSTMNLFSYAAEWGFDDLDPGPGVWQGDVNYGNMTFWIALLGEDMDTSEPTDPEDGPCDDGTGGSDWLDATLGWLAGHPINRYRIGKNASEHYCPTLSTAANWAASGAIVNICYGRYTVNPGSLVLGGRTGGHCVTVTYAHADGPSVLELYVRDPADDDDLNSQSPWAYNIFDVETRVIQQDWDDNASYFQVPVTVINYDDEAETIRLIDSVHILKPWIGYSWSNVELNLEPVGVDFGIAPPYATFSPPQGFQIADVAQGFPEQKFYVLATESQLGHLQVIDPMTGLEDDIAVIPEATDLAIGRRGELFVLAGSLLHLMGDHGQVERTHVLPVPCQAMAVRDAKDQVILYSSTHQRMVVMDMQEGVIVYDETVLLPPSAAPSIAVRERDGVVGVLIPELNQNVYGIQLNVQPEVEKFNIPELDVSSIAFDDQGHLVVSTGEGEVRDFVPGPEGWWDWDKPDVSLYKDAKTLGAYRVSMSRTNYDPVLNAIDDIEIPADEIDYHGIIVVECAADLNGDGQLNVLDFVKFQELWQANDAAADCNGDDVFDILDFVCYQALFQQGCP